MSKIKFEVEIDATNVKQVNAAIEFFRQVADLEEKPKKSAPKKKETEAVKDTETVETKETTKPSEGAIKIETVRATLAKKVGDHRSAIKNKLTELGAANVTSLKSENYEEFLDFLNSL